MLKLSRLKKYKCICLILVIGLILRFIGIKHGFPFIFHPDEPSVIRSAFGIQFDPNPGHFDWPHLHFYLNYIVYFLFIKFRGLLQILNLRSVLEPIIPLFWRDPLVFYLISRAFNALLGAFTAVPVYLTGKLLFNKKVGLFSALAIVLMPFHVHTSHFALIDIPMVFWVSLGLYFSARIYKSSNLLNYILAGIFIGLAASTKYHGGLTAPIVLLAHLFRIWGSSSEKIFSMHSLRLLIVSGLFSVSGFLIGTPYALLDFDTFTITENSKGALWQFTNVGGVSLTTQFKQLFDVLSNKLPDDFGYTFLLMFFFGLFSWTGLTRLKKKEDYIKLSLLFIPALFLFFYISGFEKTRSHFYLITYPFVAIIVGYFCNYLLSLKTSLYKVLLVFIFVIPLIFSFKLSMILHRQDTRQQLYVWLSQNTTQEDTLLFNSDELAPIIEKLKPHNKDEIGDVFLSREDLDAYLANGDVVLVYQIDDAKLEDYKSKLEQSSLKDFEVAYFDNHLRRGDNIVVYHIKKL